MIVKVKFYSMIFFLTKIKYQQVIFFFQDASKSIWYILGSTFIQMLQERVMLKV